MYSPFQITHQVHVSAHEALILKWNSFNIGVAFVDEACTKWTFMNCQIGECFLSGY